MNKLWVFGGSLATGFKADKPDWEDDKTFAGIIANKLNLTLENLAHPNQCNFVNTLKFIDSRDEMKDGDCIIFHITPFDRWNIFPWNGSSVEDMREFIIKHTLGLNDEIKRLNDIKYVWFKKHVHNWLKNNPNIKCVFFSDESKRNIEFDRWNILCNFISCPDGNDKFGIYEDWQNSNPQFWNRADDRHFNELGHSEFAKHLINYCK